MPDLPKMNPKEQTAYDEALRRIEKCRLLGKGGRALTLGGLGLTHLPPEIGQLTALTELHLDSNQLSSLPPEIGQLTALTMLDVSDNQLTSLPPEIGRLIALTRLDAYSNKLTSLPPEFGMLSNLQIVELNNNKLTSLPPEFGQLSALTVLYLFSNQLTSLPPEFGMLSNLTIVYLNYNQLTSLPPQFSKLTALRLLDLSLNELTSVPLGFGQLSKLTHLFIHHNCLTRLPLEFGGLSALTQLYLHNNQLTSLPRDIGQLAELEQISLGTNLLADLPTELSRLTNLKELYLHQNPRLGLLAEILGPTFEEVKNREAAPADPKEILEHYFAQRRGTTRPLNEVKVLVVGESEVGKTSLIRQLRGESYNDKEDKTHGIERHRLMLNCGRLGEVRLNVWDFGGQDIMHATHQFFLSRRSVYVLVLDSRQNERQTRIDYWLRLIASYGGDSPVIVVCNKADQQVMQLNWTALQREHPQIKFFAREVCCYHVGKVDRRKGLEELRQFIAQAVEQHVEEVDRPMLDTWLDLKNELETDGRPYLTLQEYHALASERGITDGKDRDLLLTLMHRLGSVLHFSEHAIFEEERARRATPAHVEELNVLDPGWVTGAIYRLLNDAGLIRAGGRMDRGSMRAALATLPGRCYPESKEDFIIAMMRRFEICFAFDGEQDQWFLPDLLPMDEVDTGDWQGAMTFRYQYKVLPGSVMGRFLVRLHGHIANRCLWRTGAKFRKDQTEALVRSNTEEARVDIFIRGGSKRERQDFLALIRGTLEDIHRSFSGHLPVEEQISIPKHPEVYVDYKRLLLMEANGTPGDLVMIHDKLEGIQVAEVLNQVTDKTRRNDERRRRAPQIINNHYYGDYVGGNQSMSDQHIQIGGNAQGNAFGHGSHVTTTNSFNSGIQDETLKQLFETLTAQLEPLRDEMKGRDIKALDEHLEVLKAEAEKPEAERDTSQISVSGKGLIEAAKTVQDIAGPVITTAGLILEFLGVSLP